jgi:hypothetical protein
VGGCYPGGGVGGGVVDDDDVADGPGVERGEHDGADRRRLVPRRDDRGCPRSVVARVHVVENSTGGVR